MPAFPQSWLEELHARNDIVEVIGNYVALNPKGGRHWGLCPFHGEKTASFSVSGDKQLYYCFGCHMGGDVIHFVRNMEKLSYMEAVHFLANRANLPLPETIDNAEMQRERDLRERFYQINRETARFFFQELREETGKEALQYLSRRGIQGKTVQTFGLGYASPSGQRLKGHLAEKGYALADLQALGLVKGEADQSYDAFRNRLIFPIIARNKQVIAFGGRVLGEGIPKYLNSPESAVFSKRRNLYGLNLLRGKTLDALVLVEGYMDVISLYQAGVTGVVATLGTALTPQQARLIKSYTPKVYLAYDGDAAGQNAALKGIDVLQREGLETSVLRFPAGQDPDDFARTRGKEGFAALCRNALSANAYKLERIKERFDLSSPQGREQYAKEGTAFIQRLSPIEQELYFGQLSRDTDFSVDALRREGQQGASMKSDDGEERRTSFQRRKQEENLPEGVSAKRLGLERRLIAAAAAHGEAMGQMLARSELFVVPAHKSFLRSAQEMPQATVAIWLANMPEDEVSFLSATLNTNLGVYDKKVIEDALQLLWQLQIEEEIARLKEESDDENTLVSRKMDCIKQIRLLNELLLNAIAEKE